MSILSLPSSLDDLELAWLKESYAEGYGKTGKCIAQRNYVLNPNAEVDTTSVVPLSSVVTRDITDKWIGAASYKVVTDGVTANAGILFFLSNNRPAGKKWRGGLRIKFPAGAQFSVIYRHWDGTASRDYSTLVTGDDTWQYVTTPASVVEGAPVNGTFGWFGVRITDSAARTFWVDEAVLSTGSDNPDYFDGTTADNAVWTYDWEGTPNNSASIKWAKEPIVAENLFWDNPSFEGPSLPYAVVSAVFEASTEQFLDGTKSLKVTATATVATPQIFLSAGSFTANRMYPNTTYTLSAWSYSPETNQGSGPRIRIGGAGVINGEGNPNPIKGKWVRHILIFTTGPTAIPLVGLTVSNVAGDITYWDRVTLVKGSAANDFVGTTPNAAWLTEFSGSVLYDVNARDLAFLEKNYWSKLSGLVEPASLADHKLAALRAGVKTVAGDPLTVVDRNYVLDPTAENAALPGISAARGTIARSNAKVKSGSYAVEFTSDANVGGKYIVLISSSRKVLVSPGDVITHRFSVAKDALAGAQSIQSRIFFIDSQGNFSIAYSSAPFPVGDAFTDVVNQIVAPVNTVSVQVEMLFISSSIPSGDKFYFDEMYVGVNGLGNYFNPDTNLSRWTGATNNSTSELVDPSKNTIGDLWVSYLMSRSGLSPASKWSMADHELAFYKSQLGL